jgi:hypothetical protein
MPMNKIRDYLRSEDAEQLERLFAGPWPEVWDHVEQLWKRADAVYMGIIGPATDFHVRLEFVVAMEICSRYSESLQGLFQALHHASPLVAAYSLLALREWPSWSKEKLPNSVLARSEIIQWHAGCFRWPQPVGEGLRELVAERPIAEDPWERAKEAERRWAGKERSCPKCGARFISVQNLGVCPGCRYQFRASQTEARA